MAAQRKEDTERHTRDTATWPWCRGKHTGLPVKGGLGALATAGQAMRILSK